MPVSKCLSCNAQFHWDWEDAFLKFGFGDGDQIVMTEAVADVLRGAGYTVQVMPWGIHNVVIDSILKNGVEQLLMHCIRFGYDSPRDYLPKKLIRLLDRHLAANAEVAV